MAVLCFLAIAVPALTHDLVPVKVVGVALVGALVLYAPLVLLFFVLLSRA